MPALRIRMEGIGEALTKLDEDITAEASRQLRASALLTLGDLKLVTPVDTGAARNSWNASRSSGDFKVNGTPILTARGKTLKTIDSIYITNRLAYIRYLNQGSSTQAPANFIETTFMRYFDVIPDVEFIDL